MSPYAFCQEAFGYSFCNCEVSRSKAIAYIRTLPVGRRPNLTSATSAVSPCIFSNNNVPPISSTPMKFFQEPFFWELPEVTRDYKLRAEALLGANLPNYKIRAEVCWEQICEAAGCGSAVLWRGRGLRHSGYTCRRSYSERISAESQFFQSPSCRNSESMHATISSGQKFR